MVYMSVTTLIDSNTFNTTLVAGVSVSGDYTDTSTNTAVKVWAYSDQNLQISILYSDSSSGTNPITEVYPIYANNTVAINSTKKKQWSKTVIANPADGTDATKVVVKTRHSIRDPQPVLTYQTDDITLQANFDMESFEVSLTNINLDASNSTVRVYGGIEQETLGDYRLILTDTSGRVQVGSTSTNPVYITASAEDSTISVYGTDESSTSRQLLTDTSGRQQVKLYGQDAGGDTVANLLDASGRTMVSMHDGSGNALTTTNGALNVYIGSSAINVDISVDDNIVVHGKTVSDAPVAVSVTTCGEVVTTNPYINGPVELYSSATHVDADTSTSIMTIGANSRQVNIMGQSSQLCTLALETSPDNSTFYATSYSIIIKETDTGFYASVPSTGRYLYMIPDSDTSLTIKYTY